MIEEHAELVDRRRGGANFCLSGSNVFAVLATARIRAVRAGDECQGTTNSVGRHLAKRVGEQRMPVAIAPVDRQMRAVSRKFLFEYSNECPVLIVDRAAAAELVVMLGHFKHSLAGHVSAAQHIFEKRQNVVRSVRAAERYD